MFDLLVIVNEFYFVMVYESGKNILIKNLKFGYWVMS